MTGARGSTHTDRRCCLARPLASHLLRSFWNRSLLHSRARMPLGLTLRILRGGRCFLLRQFLAIEFANNAGDVCSGFVVRRNASITLHPVWACVVSSEGFDEIEIVLFKKLPQIRCTALHVVMRIKRVSHSQLRGSPWHQLHQPLGALR